MTSYEKALKIIKQINQDETRLTPSDEIKWAYSYFLINVLMRKIRSVSKQPLYGTYHSLDHSEQVGLFGLDYALSLKKNPLPVLFAAVLHDCARENDNYDETHGKECAQGIAPNFLQKFSPLLTVLQQNQIIDAIWDHTLGKVPQTYISACLWDADRTRLSWARGYNEKYFSTHRAKQIASLDIPSQIEYIKKQDDFLGKHNLKTIPMIMNQLVIRRRKMIKGR